MQTGDVATRRAAVLRLSTLSEDVSVELLQLALSDEDRTVRLAAARMAIAFDMRSFNAAVRPWLSSNNAEERLVAVELLARKPEEADIVILSRSLMDPDPHARAAAAEGLGRVALQHQSLARPALMNALDDPEVKVRIEVAAALGKIGDSSVSVAVAAHLPDPEASVRAQLAIALGTIGDPSVVPALLVAASDQQPQVVAKVAEALGMLSAEESVPTLTAIVQSNPQGEAGRAAARALARIRTPLALAEIAKGLDDEHTAKFAYSLLEGLKSEALPTVQSCIESAVGIRLERCVALSRSVGVPVAALLDAQSDGRILAETLLRLSTGRTDRELEILALELLEEGPAQRYAALEFLQSSQGISKTAFLALARTLRKGRAQSTEAALLLQLLSRSDVLNDRIARQLGKSFLESTAPDVRAGAAALLVASGVEGKMLRGLLLQKDAGVASQAALRLRRGMTVSQAVTVVQILIEHRSGRRRLLLSTLVGVPAGITPGLLEDLRLLFEEARGHDRDALLMAFVNNGGADFMDHVMGASGKADLFKLAQIAAFHPTAAQWAPRLLNEEDARLKSVALVALGMQGASSDATLILPFVSEVAGRPFFLRAAALSALVLLGERGKEFAFPPELLSSEFCSSKHLGLRTQALRFASQVGRPCGDVALADVLRLDRSPQIREVAAQLLSRDELGSTALRRCLAYEPRSKVAAWCDPTSAEATSTIVDEPERRFEVLQLDAGIEGRNRSFTPVAVGTELGSFVTVTDRSGKFLVPSGKREILPSALTY